MTNEQQPAQPAQPDPRPQPQYGEMAPEGWTWTPPSADPQSAGAQGGGSPQPQFPAQQSAPQPQGQMPGVPHNLGVGAPGAAPSGSQPQQSGQPYQPAQPVQPGQPQSQQPYRADPPPHYQQPAWQQQASGGDNKGADRVITIVLLVIGALGALYFAFTLFVMTQSMYVLARLVGLDDLTIPGSVATLGLVGALIMLTLYAVTLIFSIQRIRARKLAFWVPLVAGVLSVIILIIFTMLAVAEVPSLMHYLSDPDVLSRLLDLSTS